MPQVHPFWGARPSCPGSLRQWAVCTPRVQRASLRSDHSSEPRSRHCRKPMTARMRYCGIDVSAKPGQQQLCTLHPRRAADGSTELVATFYEPGDVEAVARTVLGFGREAVVAVDEPSGRRLVLIAPGLPLGYALALPDGRYERSRVCDALLFRRRLPLYPVPSTGQALAAWEGWIE